MLSLFRQKTKNGLKHHKNKERITKAFVNAAAVFVNVNANANAAAVFVAWHKSKNMQILSFETFLYYIVKLITAYSSLFLLFLFFGLFFFNYSSIFSHIWN